MPTVDYKSYEQLNNFGRGKHKPKKFTIYVFFPLKGKTITQSQEVDVHTLIGNIGGYIGLFLGRLLFTDIFDLLFAIKLFW